MTVTILYLNTKRRERLRDAFAMNIRILGPFKTAQLVDALIYAYQPEHSTRNNYNRAMHALYRVAGLQGLAATCLIKEAWNEGSLSPQRGGRDGEQELANITHLPTSTLQ